jgi:threonine/homoserine/homoserine lactone efflux protein
VFSLLLRGFVLGFAVAASPGPIFFLCVRRTLVQGRLYGLLSGFGVATADGFYATLATFGIAAVTTVLVAEARPLTIVGGLLLVALGAWTLRERAAPAGDLPAPSIRGLAWAYFSTLGATITNPATIISFGALAATLGSGISHSIGGPALVVAGVLLGSALWWCLLALAASWVKPRLTPRVVRGIGLVSGVAIIALGAIAVYTALA